MERASGVAEAIIFAKTTPFGGCGGSELRRRAEGGAEGCLQLPGYTSEVNRGLEARDGPFGGYFCGEKDLVCGVRELTAFAEGLAEICGGNEQKGTAICAAAFDS